MASVPLAARLALADVKGRCRAIPLPYRDLTRLRLLIREYLRCVAPLNELLLWVDRLTGMTETAL